jgi:hypothetical protein
MSEKQRYTAIAQHKAIVYCTGGIFQLVSLLGHLQQYRCNKCGMIVNQTPNSTVALPFNHRSASTISAFFEPTVKAGQV